MYCIHRIGWEDRCKAHRHADTNYCERHQAKAHRMVVIGHIGGKHCYLDLTNDQAIRRYCSAKGIEPTEFDSDLLTAFEFNDQFEAYDAWSTAS